MPVTTQPKATTKTQPTVDLSVAVVTKCPSPIRSISSGDSAPVDEHGEPIDEHGPQLITVRRKYGHGEGHFNQVDAYPVHGTENVWAVYRNIDRPKRWVGLHVPSGRAAYNNFASREEAEDILCWIWCNSIDQKGLHSSEARKVTDAMGARVMSRFRGGGPFKQPRRKRTQKIGQTVVAIPDDAAHYVRRLQELGAEREAWLQQMYGEQELLAEQDRQATLRETTLREAEQKMEIEAKEIRETAVAFAVDQRQKIADAKAQVTTLQDQNMRDQQVLTNQGFVLNRLRTAMFHALQAVDVGAVLADGETSIGRQLRKIRIKRVVNAELDQPEPDESS